MSTQERQRRVDGGGRSRSPGGDGEAGRARGLRPAGDCRSSREPSTAWHQGSPRGRSAGRLALRAGCLALGLAVLPAAPPARAGPALSADFEWSMPDRYGFDARTMLTGALEPDEILDYLVTFPQSWTAGPDGDSSPEIHPPSWRVDLDASLSTGDITSYRWSVDAGELGESASPAFSATFPREGTYAVTLTVTGGSGDTASTTRNVVVQDWLIVAIGDSYASGEGNPELGDLAWFDALVGAYGDLETEHSELADAVDALDDAQLELELTNDEIAPALSALDTWNRECPSISRACTNARSNLIAELSGLGFNEVSQMLTQGYQYVRDQILALRQAAQEAVDAAEAAVALAEASVAAAQEEIDNLFREGAAWQTIPEAEKPGDGACHRSSVSGQSRAALAIERSDPRTSVTFIHLACSGAEIVSGQNDLVDDQIPLIRELVGDREIDALLVSIGGNDAGFADIMTSLVVNDTVCGRVRELAAGRCRDLCEADGNPAALCEGICGQVADALEDECHERVGEVEHLPRGSAEELLEDGLEELESEEEGYPRLEEELAEHVAPLPADRVFLTEYPNLVEDDDGEVCPDYLTVTHEDWRWAGEEMTVSLNDTIREGSETHGWTLVEGVYDGFGRHGYCADEHWVVRAEESFMIQGDPWGSVHPNPGGHMVYRERIRESLMAGFYPQGLSGPPRSPGYGAAFRRGDCNHDGAFDLSDAISTLGFLFLGDGDPACRDACDSNDDNVVDISDAIGILRVLFLGEGQVPLPGSQSCGSDPTPGPVSCELYSACT